ncbi:hypothetical protein Ancab_021644 [Ancistrocladus abbreviatus]
MVDGESNDAALMMRMSDSSLVIGLLALDLGFEVGGWMMVTTRTIDLWSSMACMGDWCGEVVI